MFSYLQYSIVILVLSGVWYGCYSYLIDFFRIEVLNKESPNIAIRFAFFVIAIPLGILILSAGLTHTLLKKVTKDDA